MANGRLRGRSIWMLLFVWELVIGELVIDDAPEARDTREYV